EILRTRFANCGGARVGQAVRRFARRQDGGSAVEFGLIAAPFLALTFAIMETAVIFFSGQALETAVADSARLIMTGQAQTQGFDLHNTTGGNRLIVATAAFRNEPYQ